MKAATATRRRPQLASLELLGDGHHFETVQVRIDSRQDMKTSEKEGLPPCPYLQFAVTDRVRMSQSSLSYGRPSAAVKPVMPTVNLCTTTILRHRDCRAWTIHLLGAVQYGYSMRACAFREKAKALDGVLVVHRSYCITGFGLKKKGRPVRSAW